LKKIAPRRNQGPLARKITELREAGGKLKNGITGVSASLMQKIENENKIPSNAKLQKLAAAFGDPKLLEEFKILAAKQRGQHALEVLPPEFTVDQLKSGDTASCDRAYRFLYNRVLMVLGPYFREIPPTDLGIIAGRAIQRLIDESVDKAKNVEDLEPQVIAIAKRIVREQKTVRPETASGPKVSVLVGEPVEQQSLTDLAADLQEELERRERLVRLHDTLKRFSPLCQQVIRDYYLQHLPENMIAEKRKLGVDVVAGWIEQANAEFRPIYPRIESAMHNP
jgi:transcriptional regulator with XRE-family HTH domain